jgi:hypothetical protein
MAIRSVGSPVVTTPTTSTTRAATAAPATAAKAAPAGASGVSTFQAAATASGPNTAHVESNVDEVNTEVNRAIDDIAQSKAGDDVGPFANELYAIMGLKYYKGAGAGVVMDKVRAYIKDHPDASLEDVKTAMRGEAIATGQIMKMMEKSLEESMQKNPWKDE